MPLYEYKCFNCEKVFIVAMTLLERDRGATAVCPGCGSKDVRQILSPFIAKTVSKTA